MDDSVNDMFADAAATPSEFLRGLAARTVELKELVAGHQAIITELNREIQEITFKRMVDAMAQCGVDELKLPDGTKFKIMLMVSGSLPKEAEDPAGREAAIAWLTDNGHAGLLKTEINVQFEKSGHNMALDLQQRLIEEGLPATLETGVHAATLQAWARELIKAGDTIPEDTMKLLGLNTGTFVKVTIPKEKL